MEVFGNFPEKYEIFRTIFLPHVTNFVQVIYTGGAQANLAFHPSGVDMWVAFSTWWYSLLKIVSPYIYSLQPVIGEIYYKFTAHDMVVFK